MNYQQTFEKAQSEDRVTSLNRAIINWEEAGQRVIGRVTEVKDFESSFKDNPCKQYCIDTDDGEVSCVLGSNTDQYIDPSSIIGKIISILFQGKGKTRAGNSFNRFQIQVVDDAT